MAELKRDIVKYIRDRAKNKYEKGSECYICGTEVKLDFHHAIRDDFIEEHWAELYEHTVTLCYGHHRQLHKVYGRNPALTTAKKQMRWVQIQRDKHGMV